ncbi:cysteine proteinase 1-like [Ostrea edulis]|uniref:cysteine proteinase 1-like n=1 Tax=Ostrea edulis TaxID=37623 RepID=UPI002094E6EF|nr:cysteine proteinase 1-like [Ostrea edulis]XP_048752238.1 cysteine proteinase 1-like [Ostrea edulis]
MSFRILALCLFCATFSPLIRCEKYPEDAESALHLFQSWKREHNKEYQSHVIEQSKFKVFLENLKVINELNVMFKGKTTFGLNHLADLSQKEFSKTVLMPKRRAPVFERERYLRSSHSAALPDSFDWTGQKKVTPVKDQGAAGSCWAFSAIGNIEGLWAVMGKPLTNFSVEQIVDCDGMEDVPKGEADCGVFGGWPFLAYQYVMKAGGLETWEDYWYCSGLGGAPGTCAACPAPGYNTTLCGPPIPYCNMSQSCVTKLDVSKFHPGLNVVSWKAIDENETSIAEQLIKIGPLSVALNAELLQFYHHGIFDPPSFACNPKSLDHGVLIVGFGSEKSIFGTKDYWKVKNSWGPKWGENGYFRILRGQGKCGINTAVTTAVLAKN